VAASNPPHVDAAENHGLRFEGIPNIEFARKSTPEPQFPTNPIAAIPAISIINQTLRNISRSTNYHNEIRTHLSLEKDAPISRAVERAGHIHCRPILGGLHHQYVRI
jgi:hypothetical protein